MERLESHEVSDMRGVYYNLDRQFHLAENGDPAAVELLYYTALKSTRLLEILAWKNPQLLLPYSHLSLVWPGLIGNKAKTIKDNEGLIKRLEQGKDCPLKGTFNLDSPATLQAMNLLSWLRNNEKELTLPPLSPESWEYWFKIGWARLLWATQGRPEENELLKDIGDNQGKTKTNDMGLKKVGSTLKSNIRDRIKGAIRSSFKTLTKYWKKV